MKRSAGLKTNNDVLPKCKRIKSVTTPSIALSRRFPIAPPIINAKASLPKRLSAFTRNLNRKKTIIIPIANKP